MKPKPKKAAATLRKETQAAKRAASAPAPCSSCKGEGWVPCPTCEGQLSKQENGRWVPEYCNFQGCECERPGKRSCQPCAGTGEAN